MQLNILVEPVGGRSYALTRFTPSNDRPYGRGGGGGGGRPRNDFDNPRYEDRDGGREGRGRGGRETKGRGGRGEGRQGTSEVKELQPKTGATTPLNAQKKEELKDNIEKPIGTTTTTTTTTSITIKPRIIPGSEKEEPLKDKSLSQQKQPQPKPKPKVIPGGEREEPNDKPLAHQKQSKPKIKSGSEKEEKDKEKDKDEGEDVNVDTKETSKSKSAKEDHKAKSSTTILPENEEDQKEEKETPEVNLDTEKVVNKPKNNKKDSKKSKTEKLPPSLDVADVKSEIEETTVYAVIKDEKHPAVVDSKNGESHPPISSEQSDHGIKKNPEHLDTQSNKEHDTKPSLSTSSLTAPLSPPLLLKPYTFPLTVPIPSELTSGEQTFIEVEGTIYLKVTPNPKKEATTTATTTVTTVEGSNPPPQYPEWYASLLKDFEKAKTPLTKAQLRKLQIQEKKFSGQKVEMSNGMLVFPIEIPPEFLKPQQQEDEDKKTKKKNKKRK